MSVRLTLLVFAVGSLMLVACGGDDGDDGGGGAPSDAAAVLADRVLRIGEEFGTQVEGRVGDLPPSLQLALNPDVATLIDSAVDEGGDRLATIADAAGVSPEKFTQEWSDDRTAAFARFASGATEPSGADESTPLEELGINELVALPVHPHGELLGSVHASRPSGEQLFFISYDVPEADSDVEATLSGQLDQSPWQVTGGQSSEDLSVIGFQSTTSGDLQGSAFVQPIVQSDDSRDAASAGDDSSATDRVGKLTSVIYVIVVQALVPADLPDFVLPPSRPLPGDFPLPLLIFEDETVLTVNWATAPGQSSYQFTLLSPEPTFDVVDEYRQILLSEGYDLLSDQAQGFQTIIDFGSEDGTVIGRLSVDEFVEDDSLTAVVLEVSVSATPSN